jgi:hypothetical protein
MFNCSLAARAKVKTQEIKKSSYLKRKVMSNYCSKEPDAFSGSKLRTNHGPRQRRKGTFGGKLEM